MFIVCASDIRQYVVKLNVKIVAEGSERLISVKNSRVISLQLGRVELTLELMQIKYL